MLEREPITPVYCRHQFVVSYAKLDDRMMSSSLFGVVLRMGNQRSPVQSPNLHSEPRTGCVQEAQ